jgi:hypothetical protein
MEAMSVTLRSDTMIAVTHIESDRFARIRWLARAGTKRALASLTSAIRSEGKVDGVAEVAEASTTIARSASPNCEVLLGALHWHCLRMLAAFVDTIAPTGDMP